MGMLSLLLILTKQAEVNLQDKPKDIRGGFFSWANALNSQRALVNGKELPESWFGTQIKFDGGKLDFKPLISHIVKDAIGDNTVQKILNESFEQITGSSKSLARGLEESIFLDSVLESCDQLEFIAKMLCDAVPEKYMKDMRPDQTGAQIASFIAVFLVLALFFALSLILYIVYCFGCCCCCCCHDGKSPSICPMIPFLIGIALMVIGAIFVLFGFQGPQAAYDTLFSLPGPGGYLDQVLTDVNKSFIAFFDNESGLPSSTRPVFNTIDNATESFVRGFDTVFDHVFRLRDDVIAVLESVYEYFDALENPTAHQQGCEGLFGGSGHG
jgi:hypothetical protein